MDIKHWFPVTFGRIITHEFNFRSIVQNIALICVNYACTMLIFWNNYVDGEFRIVIINIIQWFLVTFWRTVTHEFSFRSVIQNIAFFCVKYVYPLITFSSKCVDRKFRTISMNIAHWFPVTLGYYLNFWSNFGKWLSNLTRIFIFFYLLFFKRYDISLQ